MRRVGPIAISVVSVLAAFATSASALTTTWEVKGPPATFAPLAPGTPETLKTKMAFKIVGKTNNVTYKSTCKGPDKEHIVNPTSGPPGVDEMTEFELECAASAPAAPAPCVVGEPYDIRGAFSAKLAAWPSRLVKSGPAILDVFEKVELELECLATGIAAIYSPPGNLWFPRLGLNSLKSSKAAGIFKNGTAVFFFAGVDSLTPALHLEVR